MTHRDQFLAAVRSAVTAGNRAGTLPLPDRAGVGYQGDGGDPVTRFATGLAAAGGQCCVVPDAAAAVAAVLEITVAAKAARVLVGRGAVLDRLELPRRLREAGLEVSDADAGREAAFAADVGVSGVDYLVAETGSVVVRSGPGQPRWLSLLPPVHVAVAERGQFVPDLFDLFKRTPEGERPRLPASLSLITGPSKTGDIELRLVTGVHGPGQVYVVLIDAPRGV